ncbi:hypothetical protein KI387_036738, partial [Taxus chinensis]
MGRPMLHQSLNVLYMENKTKVIPIDVLKDVAITIQGAKFTGDFKFLVLAEAENFPELLGCPWCYKNNADLQFSKGYISVKNKEKW